MHGANANTLHSQHCKPKNHGDQEIGRSRERHTHSIDIAKILVTLPKLLGIAPNNKKDNFLIFPDWVLGQSRKINTCFFFGAGTREKREERREMGGGEVG